MFNFFKKKTPPFPVTDKIFMNSKARERAMFERLQNDPEIIFVHWFEDSYDRSIYAAGEGYSERIYMTRDALQGPHSARHFIFIAHYPLLKKEVETFEKLRLQNAEVWSSLDDPLLRRSGGDRIVEMMTKLGMKEEEIISHPLISKSIIKAQQKIEKSVPMEQSARDMDSWFRKNLSP